MNFEAIAHETVIQQRKEIERLKEHIVELEKDRDQWRMMAHKLASNMGTDVFGQNNWQQRNNVGLTGG